MRPVSVRFRCFGPYMQEQFVDFEALQRSGLFLICGETGAGKTTILDAICYALYGRSSGGLRGDLSVMRCKLAQQTDETLTEFVFDSNGKRYKFVRSLKYGRKNLNDSHNCLVQEGEKFVPLFENPKATFVNKKAEELIGLSYDQFRQVILLPQGQFEKLLVSDSAEKEKILVSLFHADRWQKIAEELYRRVAEQDVALKQEKLQIAGKLREYGCETLSQLEEKRVQQAASAEQLQRQTKQASCQVDIARREKEAALLADSGFSELARREKQLAALEREQPRFASEDAILQKAEAAEQIRPQYLRCQDAKRNLLRQEKLTFTAKNAVTVAKQTLTQAEEKWNVHLQQRQADEQNRQKLLRLEESRELYQTLEEKRRSAAAAAKQLLDTKKALQTAQAAFLRRDQLWQQAVAQQNQAIADYQSMQEVYLRSIGSTLAGKLRPGQPCPVCGSREHPAPAARTEGQVTDAQLNESKKRMTQAADMETELRALRHQAEEAQRQAAEQFQQVSQTEAEARWEYENTLTRLIPGVESVAQLQQLCDLLKRQIRLYKQAEAEQKQALTVAMGSLTAAKSRLQDALEELENVKNQFSGEEKNWQTALTEGGFESEEAYLASDLPAGERQRRQTALIQFRTDLLKTRQAVQEQQSLLEGQTAPDMKRLTLALEEADRTYRNLASQSALAENRLKTMERDGKSLQKRLETYEISRSRVDADLDYANRLRGRSGISLQRYVLGVMLTSVTSAANELLKNVCGGRYRLYRTDEIAGSGRKGGLELEVYDSRTNARRSVTTLSGGEKFLVALSLAIGLSTVVQAQGSGIRLEAMFIDEGFGSLDREAVNDALEVLQGIQRSSGVVGIISHVEQLAEVIPTRLEVTRDRQGSRCCIRD